MNDDDFAGDSSSASEHLAPLEDAYREGFARLAVQVPPAPDLPVEAFTDHPARDRRWVAVLAAAAVLTLLVGFGVRGFSERQVSPAATASESVSPSITPSASPTPSGSESPTASASESPTASGSASATPSGSASATRSPSAIATPSTRGIPAPSTSPTLTPSASAGPLTPAELALAKNIAVGGLSGPQAKATAKAWVTKSTYREFYRIVDDGGVVISDPAEANLDEPILVVLVMGSVSPTEPPAPSPYPTGIETAFVTVEASIANDPAQSYGTPIYPNRGGLEDLKKLGGPIVELDLTT